MNAKELTKKTNLTRQKFYIRPNPEGQINKNQKAENKKLKAEPLGRILP